MDTRQIVKILIAVTVPTVAYVAALGGVAALYAVAFGATVVICSLEWLRRKRTVVRP